MKSHQNTIELVTRPGHPQLHCSCFLRIAGGHSRNGSELWSDASGGKKFQWPSSLLSIPFKMVRSILLAGVKGLAWKPRSHEQFSSNIRPMIEGGALWNPPASIVLEIRMFKLSCRPYDSSELTFLPFFRFLAFLLWRSLDLSMRAGTWHLQPLPSTHSRMNWNLKFAT